MDTQPKIADAKTNNNIKMKQLSSALDVCADYLIEPIVYLDYPVYGNIGDLLIWKGTQEFFNRNNKKIIGQFSINNIGRRANKLLNKCNTICFQGGGNLGDLWPHHQKLRETIIIQFPNKRIVVLPQTVHFNNPEEIKVASNLFKQHPDLHIFLRDNNSFSLLMEQGLNNIKLCPDMAHALWNKLATTIPTASDPL